MAKTTRPPPPLPATSEIRTTAVRRDGREVTTIAVVTATVDADFGEGTRLKPAGNLQGAIASALTDWVRETAEGKESWRGSAESYNVGDLVDDLDNIGLKARLAAYGIRDLQIECVDGEGSDWGYDEVLVNENELEGEGSEADENLEPDGA